MFVHIPGLSVFKSTSSIESVLTLVSPSVFITQETDENKETKCGENEMQREGEKKGRKKDSGRKEESERGAERKKSSVQGDRNTGVRERVIRREMKKV